MEFPTPGLGDNKQTDSADKDFSAELPRIPPKSPE